MDNNYENIVPWNGANDTGRDVRLKLQRNFAKIVVNFQELECSCKPLGELLGQLESAGLIRVKADHAGDVTPEIYELTRPLFQISLLHVMEATDQHLNCNQPDCEKMYARYHRAAHKLGIINQMTRVYLSEIPLTDL